MKWVTRGAKFEIIMDMNRTIKPLRMLKKLLHLTHLPNLWIVFFAQFASLLCSLLVANLHQFNCDAWVHWVLAQDCWLLASCDTYLTSTCGSSIYQKSTSSNSAGSTYLLADGHTSITYSPTSCSEDDCSWPSFCPETCCAHSPVEQVATKALSLPHAPREVGQQNVRPFLPRAEMVHTR